MIDEKLTARVALDVYQKIVDEGVKVGDEYRLNGLYAFSDHDGYTLFIRDTYVTLTVFFHNKLNLDFRKRIHRDEFISSVIRLYHMQN